MCTVDHRGAREYHFHDYRACPKVTLASGLPSPSVITGRHVHLGHSTPSCRLRFDDPHPCLGCVHPDSSQLYRYIQASIAYLY